MKQHNVDAHELDLTIASDASHLLWQNHGEVMDDGLFRAENNVDSTDDAAADHHHDNRRVSESHEKRADKRFKRHRNEQTKELEVVFKACPNPDESLRLELSKMLGMEATQVKNWFQNRRCQKKNQIRRQDSKVIQAENELLRAENLAFREAILKKTCLTCGGPTVPAEEKPEQLRLRMENARLKDELLRASTILNDLSCTAVAHLPMPGHPSSVRMG